MRTLVLSLAAAGAALTAASPAAAQYYPAPQYGYGGGYNGYNGSFGMVRALQARIDRVESQINRLDRFDHIRDGRADRLRSEANQVERRLRYSARNGLNPWEAREIEQSVARLEQRVQYSFRTRYSGYGSYNNSYGYGDYGHDGYHRDRDRDDDDD
jgi:hypothetical protein